MKYFSYMVSVGLCALGVAHGHENLVVEQNRFVSIKVQADPQPNAVGFSLFEQNLSRGSYGFTGLVRSKKQLERLFKEVHGDEKLEAFLKGTNFEVEEVLVYSFEHAGSGMDCPAYKVKMFENTLECSVYDACDSLERTTDLHHSKHYFAVRVDKKRVKEIKVSHVNEGCRGIGNTSGRSFYPGIGEDFGLEQAVQIIKGFPDYAGKSAEEVSQLEAFGSVNYNLSEEDLKALALLPKLKDVAIKRSRWSAPEVKLLNSFKTLRRLDVGGRYCAEKSNFGDEYLSLLDIPQLRSIDLAHSSVTANGLAILAKFPRLQEIYLQGVNIGNDGIKHLTKVKQCSKLSGLRIGSSALIRQLAQELPLSELVLEKCSGNLDEDRKIFQELAKMNQLTYLHIVSTHHNLDNDAIAPLVNLVALKHLGLVGSNKLSDAGIIGILKGMKKLESLSLGRTKVGDDWIKEVGPLPIKRLDLRKTRLSATGVEWIAKNFPDIEDLNCRSCKLLDGRATEYFKKLTKLKSLNVHSTKWREFEQELPHLIYYKHNLPYHDSDYSKRD